MKSYGVMATFGPWKQNIPVPYSHKYCTVPKTWTPSSVIYYLWHWQRPIFPKLLALITKNIKGYTESAERNPNSRVLIGKLENVQFTVKLYQRGYPRSPAILGVSGGSETWQEIVPPWGSQKQYYSDIYPGELSIEHQQRSILFPVHLVHF